MAQVASAQIIINPQISTFSGFIFPTINKEAEVAEFCSMSSTPGLICRRFKFEDHSHPLILESNGAILKAHLLDQQPDHCFRITHGAFIRILIL